MSKPRSAPRRRVDGVLLLDKPAGMTSNGALQTARRLFNAAKAGHTGTLDPMATGLLPLCFGEATKFAGELLDADKCYRATVRLGIITDTADAEGQVLDRRVVEVGEVEVRRVVARFVGEIEQIPPMYSALKRDGRPLYELARQGIEVERAPRRVIVSSIVVSDWAGDRFEMEVACSKGTYIRTLAADIGARLGCGAHLAALRRTRIGDLEVADAVGLGRIEAQQPVERDRLLRPADALLAALPQAGLSSAESARIGHGQGVPWSAPVGSRWRLYDPGRIFLGLGEVSPAGLLIPRRLVAAP